jgi:acyl-coenzyme A synthetase/AMP-(fatty) acid ligase
LIPFSHEEIIGAVGERFRRVAAAIPDHVAVKTPKASITFAEMDRATDELARAILARRGPVEEPVALLLEQGTNSVMAALAIIKAGKSAVVLSPDQPLDKLAAIWEDAQKPLVVTDQSLGPKAAELTGQPALWMDFNAKPDRAFDLDSIHPRPDTLAALFYTSGTTGEPKGVMIPNELILHNAWFNYDRYQISQQDHVALMAAHGFSASMSLSLCVILIGATLHLRPGKVNQLNVLVDWLRREEMTHLILTPLALLRQQSSAMKSRVSLPHLRYVVSGGEEFRREELERYQNFLPETTAFSYRMGSTETMMMCEQTIRPGTPIPWEKIPVGRILARQGIAAFRRSRRVRGSRRIG